MALRTAITTQALVEDVKVLADVNVATSGHLRCLCQTFEINAAVESRNGLLPLIQRPNRGVEQMSSGHERDSVWQNPATRVMIMSTTSTPFTDEATTPDATFTITIDDRTMRYWDRDTPVVVNERLPIVDEYRVQYAAVGFTSTSRRRRGRNHRLRRVRLCRSGAECREFTISIGREMVDVTVFESDGWRDRLSGIGGVTAPSRLYNINNLFTERLLQQKPLVLEFWTANDQSSLLSMR